MDLPTILQNRRFGTVLNYMAGIVNYAEYGSIRSSLDSFDFSNADLLKNTALMKKANNIGFEDVKTINWFVPLFLHPYGGIYTILRFASYFQKEKGVKNRLVVCGNKSASKTGIEEMVGKAFPNLLSCETIMASYGNSDRVPEADACIATCWESAYPVMRFNSTRRKFYLVQDFEPLFFPGGTLYGLAENTYRFGFYGIMNTKGLSDLYVDEYGGIATHFVPNVDRSVFFPSERIFRKPSVEDPFNVFFYSRVGQKRNAFELGIAALVELKKRYGELVRIFVAGSVWRPSLYGLGNVVVNLGVLPYKETANLYRRCDLGIFLGFSKGAPYIPLELMACGCPVLVNYNPSTESFYRDSFNCLVSAPSISCIVDKVGMLMEDLVLRRKIISNALETLPKNSWETEIERIYNFICNPTSAEFAH